MRRSYLGIAIAIGFLPMTALANKVTSMNITPIAGYDRAPELEVYSTNGERFTNVDKTDTSRVTVRLRARCRFEGRGNKAYSGELTLPGFVRVGTKDPANFLIPHSDEASAVFRWDGGTQNQLDPVAACNEELAKRAANTPGKTKYHILAEGFTFNYPAALRTTYRFQCKATGLGRTDLDSDSELVNTRIQCKPSAQAAAKIPDDKPKPKRAAIKPARLVPLLKTGTFVASPEVHTGDCPAQIEFQGTLTANRAGTVKYRYTKFDGTQSPEYSLKFDKAGTRKTRPWRTTYSKPNAATTLSSGPGSNQVEDFQGWYRLDVLSPKPTGQIAAHYRVMCGADDVPDNVAIQAVPVKQPVEAKRTEVQQLQAVPVQRKVVPQRRKPQ